MWKSKTGGGALELSRLARPIGVARPAGLRPVGRLTKAYLKALREAEIAAWREPGYHQDTPVPPAPSPTFALARSALRAASSRAETWFFGVLVGGAAIALGWNLVRGLDLALQWEKFSGLMRQALS